MSGVEAAEMAEQRMLGAAMPISPGSLPEEEEHSSPMHGGNNESGANNGRQQVQRLSYKLSVLNTSW